MKKIAYILVVAFSLSLMACNNYGDDLVTVVEKKPEPTPTPAPTPTPSPNDSTKKDTIPTWNGDWGTPVRNNLVPVGEPTATSHMWNAVQVFYNGQADSLVRRAEVPFGYELTPNTGFSTAKTKTTAIYTGMSASTANSKNTSYGEWFNDEQGNSLRKVSNTFEIRTSEFNKTLTVSHYDGYSTVNGKEHSFKSPSVSADFKSLTVTDSTEVTRNDSVFMQRTYLLTATAKFHISSSNVKNYDVSATHVVESFLKVKEESKKSEEMPPADLYVGKLIKATDIVAFPVWVSNDKIQSWSKGSLVEDEKVYHMWVDGRFVGSYEKSKLSGTNYNAVMLDGKNYVPCLCKPDGKEGFYYSVEYADGSYKIQTVDERLAVSTGLKNFTKDNVASQTPYVKTTKEQKTYNGKVWLKLTCYNVDGKPTLSYTVAEK